MNEEPTDEVALSKLTAYGNSSFGAGEDLPKPTEEEEQQMNLNDDYSPKPSH